MWPVTAHAQVDVLRQADGPRLVLSGELLGIYTAGLMEDELRVALPPVSGLSPAGVFDMDSGRNGFMTRMDFAMMFSPVSWVELYVQFRARSRPGNPYIPLTLEAAGADDFSLSFENAWGRVNLPAALGFDVPLDLWATAGFFDSAPASFHIISRFATENVMSRLRTKGTLSFRLEGVFPAPFAESVSVIAATQQRLNESIPPLYDVDGGQGAHGEPAHDEPGTLPLFAAVQFRNIGTPLGPVSAEVVYALNAENIFSGHNFGFDAKWDIRLPGTNDMFLPVGIGVAFMEKNIDPMARAAHSLGVLGIPGGGENAIFDIRPFPDLSLRHNISTVSFRRSLRIGGAVGLRWMPLEILGTELNLAYSYSQIAHIYRDTLTLNSASADLRLTYDNRFFAGGGIFLGTLTEAQWRTSAAADPSREQGFSHVFRPAENMGFEAHAGIYLGPGDGRGRSRLVLGYNLNRGLSMNHGIEAMSEAQMISLQRGTVTDADGTSRPLDTRDGLFQTGGFFAKLVIRW